MFKKKDATRQNERERMVATQLIPRGIKDKRVLDAFRKVPRHEFIPGHVQYLAYKDHPLPIGCGQTISQPFMVASMTEQLALKGKEKVLEIGSGSGYQAAVLAELCDAVYSVERIAELAAYATENIKRAGYDNVTFFVGDGTKGWKKNAPYDGIIVTAGSPGVPETLIDQLKIGGKLVIPVGNEYSQVLTIVIKGERKNTKKELYGCMFVPLIGEEGWKK